MLEIAASIRHYELPAYKSFSAVFYACRSFK